MPTAASTSTAVQFSLAQACVALSTQTQLRTLSSSAILFPIVATQAQSAPPPTT